MRKPGGEAPNKARDALILADGIRFLARYVKAATPSAPSE